MKVVLKSNLIPISVGERFHDVAFEVSIDRASFEQRGFFRGPGVTGRMEEVLLDYPAIGQYFRMRITQGSSNYLNFEEIEVYTPY